jgi:shikimate kinase
MPLVFLIGYRCSGKTAVARLLAERRRWTWIDADHELERRAGKTIRQIFADDGERTFRDLESTVLADLTQMNDAVIATGGGVVLRPENRQLLKAGIVVWLTAPAEVLWRRMQADTATAERRPNLAQGGLAEVEALLAEREPLYRECAQYIVDSSTQSPDEIAAYLGRVLPAAENR